MNVNNIKLVAFDLDGTLTQHKTKLDDVNRAVLDKLSKKYRLLMVGAGSCMRIFNQLDGYPIDVLGNYGLQFGEYDYDNKTLVIKKDVKENCDRESVEKRITYLREKYGFTNYSGNNVEFHESGCVTFPILGTTANINDKLAFDSTREKRRAILEDVKKTFNDYVVFVGGSSSFDMAPMGYDKATALDRYCKEYGFTHEQVVYVGDDYGLGGNDESVFLSDFNFIKIDDYKTLKDKVKELL